MRPNRACKFALGISLDVAKSPVSDQSVQRHQRLCRPGQVHDPPIWRDDRQQSLDQQVGTLDESPILQDVLTQLRSQLAHATGDGDPWAWADHLTPSIAADLQNRFMSLCVARFGDILPPVVVDKLPLNIFDLGFAQAILPNARFVCMSRHPLDVGLSNFCTNFGAKHPFSQTLDGIAEVTRAVYRAADLYQDRGLDMRRQSYRALVEEPEYQIRSLLAYCGLEWDEACLSPEAGNGIVRTASVTQVRAPINRTGLDRWKNYASELTPLCEALEADWLASWEATDAAGSDPAPAGARQAS